MKKKVTRFFGGSLFALAIVFSMVPLVPFKWRLTCGRCFTVNSVSFDTSCTPSVSTIFKTILFQFPLFSQLDCTNLNYKLCSIRSSLRVLSDTFLAVFVSASFSFFLSILHTSSYVNYSNNNNNSSQNANNTWDTLGNSILLCVYVSSFGISVSITISFQIPYFFIIYHQ